MRKFGAFLARKTPDSAPEQAAGKVTPPDNPLELDEELFSAMGSQLGGENEALRNLLLDANAKIGELDTIKQAVGKLVDPVSKTLRAIEAEKAEKIALQTVLNNTRTAYGKLRNDIADLEKKFAQSRGECEDLREYLANTQNLLRTAEATRAEIAIEIAARRAQIVELEAQLAQETGEAKALREENQRLDERLTAADKRIIVLESDLNGARQRLLMAGRKARATGPARQGERGSRAAVAQAGGDRSEPQRRARAAAPPRGQLCRGQHRARAACHRARRSQ